VDPPEDRSDPVLISVRAYSAHAAAYEARYAARMLDRVERFARSLPPPARILDAGCGPGRDLARFAALGHVVSGVELNPDFAARARAHAPTVCADLRTVGSLFPAASFDGVWACSSLVHLTDVEAAGVLGQLARLLRPEGRLYACVNTIGRTGWLDEPDGRRWYTIWDPDVFARTVAEAGFRVEDVDAGPVVEVWAVRRSGEEVPSSAG
jgi:SAM-dependent methyltransferase